MSPKVVVIAVLLTLGLVVTALLTSRGTPPIGGSGSASPAAPEARVFQPARVASISLARSGGREARVVRSDAGVWTFVAGGISWPARPPETLAPALEALAAELRSRSEGSPSAGGPLLTIAFKEGEAVALRLAPASVGGRTLASVTTRDGSWSTLIENSVLEPLISPGPGGWRVPEALPGVTRCSRLTLEDAGAGLALAKIDGEWMMRRPITARASQSAATVLVSALGAIPVLSFDDRAGPDLEAMGLHRPVLTITAETDERAADPAGEVRVSSITRTLLVGGPADPKGDARFASADADGSIIMLVPSSAIDALSLAARNYLHPSPIGVAPGDVAMVMITDTTSASASAQRGFRRENAGWASMNADGTRSTTDAAPVEALIDFLASRPGEPEPFRPDDEIRVLRRIELLDADGDAREVLSAGYSADGLFAVRSGNLLVSYRGSEAPAILQLPAFESLAPESPVEPMPTLPPAAPTGK